MGATGYETTVLGFDSECRLETMVRVWDVYNRRWREASAADICARTELMASLSREEREMIERLAREDEEARERRLAAKGA